MDASRKTAPQFSLCTFTLIYTTATAAKNAMVSKTPLTIYVRKYNNLFVYILHKQPLLYFRTWPYIKHGHKKTGHNIYRARQMQQQQQARSVIASGETKGAASHQGFACSHSRLKNFGMTTRANTSGSLTTNVSPVCVQQARSPASSASHAQIISKVLRRNMGSSLSSATRRRGCARMV